MTLRDALGAVRRRLLREPPSTADTAGLPVLSPLQPVDLTDERAVTAVIRLAMKVGEVLLDSGTGAVDTAAQVRYVAATYGLTDCAVDVTCNSISVSAHLGDGLAPANFMRTVSYRSLDYSRLELVDRLIRRIGRGVLSLDRARAELDVIVEAPHPYSRKVALLGWMLMGGVVTILMDGTLPIAVISCLVTGAIYATNVKLGNIGLPFFFQQVVGGLIATLPVPIIYRIAVDLGLEVAPYRIIVSGIIVLMAGLSLVGSVQDAITGAPVTAAARFTEVLVFTAGVVAGVAMALRITSELGASLPPMRQEAFEFAPLPILILTGGGTSLAFAWASYALPRALGVSFVAGCVGTGLAGAILNVGLGPVVAYSIAATVVGFAGGLLARRAVVPPLIVAVAGITPLLPGLAVYRGLAEAMNEQTLSAISNLSTALAVGVALAAGVTLGEWMARTVRRPHVPKLAVMIPQRRFPGRPWHR